MTELTTEQKAHLSICLLEMDLEDFAKEVVPSETDPAVMALAADLGTEPPIRVQVLETAGALYGWPADSVREQIAASGGSIRFGWRLRLWRGVLLNAEFHAVWVDPEEKLQDLAPAVTEDPEILFLPDPSIADDFDWEERPVNRYVVLYVPPDRSPEIAARIARLTPGQRTYEQRRAEKANKSLEEWVGEKLAPDPVLDKVTRFVAACRIYDAIRLKLPDLMTPDPTLADEDDETTEEDLDDDDDLEAEFDDEDDEDEFFGDAEAIGDDAEDEDEEDDDEDPVDDELDEDEAWDWNTEDQTYEAEEALRKASSARLDLREAINDLLGGQA